VDSITQIHSLTDSGKFIAVWFGYEIMNIFLTYIASRILAIVGTQIKNTIKLDMSSKIARSSVANISHSTPADLTEKLSTDVDRFVDSVYNLYSEFFSVASPESEESEESEVSPPLELLASETSESDLVASVLLEDESLFVESDTSPDLDSLPDPELSVES
jgi:hypothetical protein